MRLGTLLLALLLSTACGAQTTEADPPRPQREVTGGRMTPYALSKAQVGHVLRYLDPPPGFRVVDYCLDGETDRCDLVLDDVRWSSYTTMRRGRHDVVLVGVVRHRDPERAATAFRGITGRLDVRLPTPEVAAWQAVGGEVRSRGRTDLSDGYLRGPWTVQVVSGTLPRNAEALRRRTLRPGHAVLADLDADYATLLERRRP